jgi:hypothetical protein
VILVRPRSGLRVRDPARRDFVEHEGRLVPLNAYWFRRLQDGDVVELAPHSANAPQGASLVVKPTTPPVVKPATEASAEIAALVEEVKIPQNKSRKKTATDGGADVSG